MRRGPPIRTPRRGKDSWISFASGPFGFWSITFDRTNHCQIEAYIDMGDKALNKALFDAMAVEAKRWDAATGLPLDWQRRDDRRHSRIAVRSQSISFDDVAARTKARMWATDVIVRMYDALNEPLRLRGQEFRQGGIGLGEAGEGPDALPSTGNTLPPQGGAFDPLE